MFLDAKTILRKQRELLIEGIDPGKPTFLRWKTKVCTPGKEEGERGRIRINI